MAHRVGLLVVVGVLLLGGCTGGLPSMGRATASVIRVDEPGPTPIIVNSADNVLALSGSGETVIVESPIFGLCAIPVASTGLTTADLCGGTDPDAPTDISQVEFSPDDTRAAVWRDLRTGAKGGAWIFDLTTGTTTRIPLPAVPGREQVVSPYSDYTSLSWDRQNGGLVGLGTYTYIFDAPDPLVRIDPVTAAAQVIDIPGPPDGTPTWPLQAAVGGAAVPVYGEGQTLIPMWVDFDTGQWTELSGPNNNLTSKTETIDSLLAVSPDGKKALMKRIDPASYKTVEIFEIIIATGEVSTWEKSAGMAVVSATYSPDSTEVVIMGLEEDLSGPSLRQYTTGGQLVNRYPVEQEGFSIFSKVHWSTKQIVSLSAIPSGNDPIGLQGTVGWILPS